MYHGTNTKFEFKKGSGSFGGLFASPCESVARSHGEFIYSIDVIGETLTDYELNYLIDGAFSVALEICRSSEILATAAMDAACPDCVDEEGIEWCGWEIQRFRGQIADALGFGAVEMLDEHGTTYLVIDCTATLTNRPTGCT